MNGVDSVLLLSTAARTLFGQLSVSLEHVEVRVLHITSSVTPDSLPTSIQGHPNQYKI